VFTKFNAVVYSTVYATKRPQVLERHVMTTIARKYEQFVEAYRHPDGRKWTGQEIDEATGGIVSRSYITNLRKGRIENPGYEKLKAIAKAMGFPPELWFEDFHTAVHFKATDQYLSLSDRANHLFESIRDQRTGEPYTNAQVARMSLGDITEEEVEGIRDGSIPNPPLNKVVALANVFGVHPSYFLEQGKKLPVIDEEALQIFRDETVSAIAHKSFRLSSREKQMVLNIIQQFEELHSAPERGRAT
jgi:transcriptional regulator with XRE-family HTH domain